MDILMPQLGETVTEGTITHWHKSIGDPVEPGDPLFEIETDKASMEVPVIVPGVLSEIRATVGKTVAVGTVVAIVSEIKADAAKDPTASTPTVSPAAQSYVPTNLAPTPASITPIDPFHGLRTPERNYGNATLVGGIKVTPLARRLAVEAGIDPASLRGSGPHGRIVAADVRAATSHISLAPTIPAATSFMSQYAGTKFREVPLDAMRKTIARRLTESKQQIPHFYLSAELNVDALTTLRKQFNDSSEQRVSVNDLIVKAYALSLQRVPAANVVWAGDRLLQFSASDVGVAVAVRGGLVTPIVKAAESKGIVAISRELADLVARGRERKLQPSEYTGGTATVSNLGMYGVRSFQAIVNPPQATILAVGAAERRPIEAPGGHLVAASLMTVTLSVDHRAVDGATAGELLAALRKIVESPLSIFL